MEERDKVTEGSYFKELEGLLRLFIWVIIHIGMHAVGLGRKKVNKRGGKVE